MSTIFLTSNRLKLRRTGSRLPVRTGSRCPVRTGSRLPTNNTQFDILSIKNTQLGDGKKICKRKGEKRSKIHTNSVKLLLSTSTCQTLCYKKPTARHVNQRIYKVPIFDRDCILSDLILHKNIFRLLHNFIFLF